MDNVLKPLPDDKQQEPEKPKKPVKNFIQKNREKIVRGKKGKDDDKNGTVTLTQDQLNAILASVGKVKLIGEGADDAGGVFDDTITEMCQVWLKHWTIMLLYSM